MAFVFVRGWFALFEGVLVLRLGGGGDREWRRVVVVGDRVLRVLA